MPPEEYSGSGSGSGSGDGLDGLADDLLDRMLPADGEQSDRRNGRKRINYATEATVEPLTVDHLRMQDGGVKDCYEASRVPIEVIVDMARAAREEVESSTVDVLDSDAYDWPFGKSGGMLNPFDSVPRNWIPGSSPPISVGAMMERELRRAEQLKRSGSPQKHKRSGWLHNQGRFGTAELFDSVYEGEVAIINSRVIGWFAFWRSQFTDVMDERRSCDLDWSVANARALFDLRYRIVCKGREDQERHIKLNAGEKYDLYSKSSPGIIITDTANALPKYPGVAGYLFDRCVLRLMEEYGYDMVHAWRIANMEVFKGESRIGDRVYGFGSNDLSGDFLKRRKVEPKGTRLSDGLAIYDVQVDNASEPEEVAILAREEHLIGVKGCMVPKMEKNLRQYESDED